MQAGVPNARPRTRVRSNAIESLTTGFSGTRFATAVFPLVFALLFLLVVALQVASGFLSTELVRHPDEPAHFVTGVLVFDYLRSGFHQAPLAFAEQFQSQYPKVAFGHWPPMFYGVQSLWYVVLGAHPRSLVLLLGAVTAAIASLLIVRTTKRHGLVIGIVTTALFLGTSAVQQATLIVGSDSLVTLFSFLAVLAYIDFMQRGRGRSLAVFVLWALLGLLTKGSALSLALFALLGPVFARRTAVFRSRALWIAAFAIGAVIGPLYYASLQLGKHGAMSDLVRYLAYPETRLFVLEQFLNLTSLAVLAVAVVGIRVLVVRNRHDDDLGDRRDDAAAALAWTLAVVGFQVLIPITGETRYLLPTVVAVLLLFAEGLHVVGDWLLARARPGLVAPGLLTVGLIALYSLWAPFPVLTTGYAAVARAIPTTDTTPVRVLISSNPQGEGAFVAERLVHDPTRASYVLRAYKVLVDDDWFGKTYLLKARTIAEVRDTLHSNGIGFVVVDDFGQPPASAQPHHQLLHQMLAAYPHEFTLIGRFDINVGGRRVADAVKVYRRSSNLTTRRGVAG